MKAKQPAKWGCWAYRAPGMYGTWIHTFSLGKPRCRNREDKAEIPACQNHHLITGMLESLVPGTWVCPVCHAAFVEYSA